MERRQFLRALAGGLIAAHQLDIEKLLWVPGKKTIFIPPVVIPAIFIPPPVEQFVVVGLTPRYWDYLIHRDYHAAGDFLRRG